MATPAASYLCDNITYDGSDDVGSTRAAPLYQENIDTTSVPCKELWSQPLEVDLDVCVLFSANPSTYNRSGKVIPQLKDRIGTTVVTHYPEDRDLGIQITRSQSAEDGVLELEDERRVKFAALRARQIEARMKSLVTDGNSRKLLEVANAITS